MNFFKYILIISSTAVLFQHNIVSAGTVDLQEDLARKPLGLYLEYIEDRDKSLDLEKILSDEKKKALPWTRSGKDMLGFGYTNSIIWVRFIVKNPAQRDIQYYLQQEYPAIDYLDLYFPEGNGKYKTIKTGDRYPFSHRPLEYRNYVFPLTLRAGGSAHIYFRFETVGSMNVHLFISSPSAFQKMKDDEAVLFWMIYGIFLVMFVYNIIVFLATRDWSYFFYILYIASCGIFIMTMKGMSTQYLWPGNVWLSNYAVPLSWCIIIISIIQFAVFFINIKKYSKALFRILNAITAAAFFPILLIAFDGSYLLILNTSNILTLLAVIVGLFTLIYLLVFKKSRQAGFFLGSFVPFLFGAILMALHLRGTITGNVLTINSLQIGAVFQLITLSLGLADKINSMRKELKHFNQQLEKNVEERTMELQASNEELEAVNMNLLETRDALWGEMELAKKIQTVLLPHKTEVPGFSIAAYMRPADEVGGDYYDIINANGMDWIIIGDVSGHGVSAGLVMMMVQTSVHTVLKVKPDADPSFLLSKVNQVIYENIKMLGEDKYMTITVFACIKYGVLHFSGLHQNIIVYRRQRNDIDIVETSGMWIGVVDDITEMSKNSTLSLDVDDIMLIYTDGITEAVKKNGGRAVCCGDYANMFEEEKLYNILRRKGEDPVDEIKEEVLKELDGYQCFDDVTMVIVKRVK